MATLPGSTSKRCLGSAPAMQQLPRRIPMAACQGNRCRAASAACCQRPGHLPRNYHMWAAACTKTVPRACPQHFTSTPSPGGSAPLGAWTGRCHLAWKPPSAGQGPAAAARPGRPGARAHGPQNPRDAYPAYGLHRCKKAARPTPVAIVLLSDVHRRHAQGVTTDAPQPCGARVLACNDYNICISVT